jgi:predicted ATPase/class 3 adenylate cyclase/predicted Ser/Thr protein kinase
MLRGRYEPLAVAGRGGQGEVLKALDHQHGRHVALKVCNVRSDTERASVLQEARVLLELTPHSALPLVREDFFEEDRYYLVMDWIEGPNLQRVVEDRGDPGLPLATVLSYVAPVAEALAHLHAHTPAVVHQDVKPANIILAQGDRVVLVDFGVARRAGQAGPVAGTAGFAAPELGSGLPPTPATDVYGLAATTFALLTGSPPAGVRPDWEGVPVAGVGSVERTLATALSVRPARRPGSAAEFMQRLRAWERPLPEGVITFMLTDVEGSTALWERAPDDMRVSLVRHESIIREAVEATQGQLMKSKGEGDSCFAVFRRATDGASAALRIQRRISGEQWPAATPLRVRVALHTGEAELREGDYFGPTVNRCARLRAVAWGGQIVVSQATADLVRDALPADAALADLGLHALKDLSRPERVWQLSDGGEEFPSLRSLNALPHNLPPQLTSFVGREEDAVRLRSLLQAERLVTITGAGGCGKTRLSVQLGAELLDEYADGVWLVEFAPLTDDGLVWSAVAGALGIREAAARAPREAVLDHLRGRSALVILDNCEHLIARCAELAEAVLRTCPGVRVLATSREPLGVPGEAGWRLPSLSVPDADASPDAALSSEAVRLFVDRAAKARPGFALTPTDATGVVEICRRLDGIPLAIELAAARAAMLSIEQIGARLHDRFRLLTGGSRTALPRQQTLRAAVDWSYNLLPEAERRLFEALSVFVGGFTLEAAEGVGRDGARLEEFEILDLLAQLSNKSLVVVDDVYHPPRYQMLETIRQYAREKALDADPDGRARSAHRDWFLQFAENADSHLHGPEQRAWLNRLEAEHDNLRAALEWSAESGGDGALRRMSVALGGFWQTRGHLSEGRTWLRQALDAPDDGDGSLRARALSAFGALAEAQADYDVACLAFEDELALTVSLDNESGRARALQSLARLAYVRGDYEKASALAEESLALAEAAGDRRGTARALGIAGAVARDHGEHARARELCERSLALAREGGEEDLVVERLVYLGTLAWQEGDYAAARASYEEALPIARRLGVKRGIATLLSNLGAVADNGAEYEKARTLYEESLGIARELHDKRLIATVLGNLASLVRGEGDLDEAHRLYEESLGLVRQLGAKQGIARVLGGLGEVAHDLGELDRAAELFEEQLTLSREMGDKSSVGQALKGLSGVACDAGDLAKASGMAEEALQIAEDLRNPLETADALLALGTVARLAGETDRAHDLLTRALRAGRDAGNFGFLASLLEAFAYVLVVQGAPQRAARLIGAADTLRTATGARLLPGERTEAEKILAACRRSLGEQALERALSEGRAAGADGALEDLLG